MKRFIFSLLVAISYLPFAISPASADVSLGINPPIIQIEAIPPAKLKTPITVANDSDKELEFEIVYKPFRASNNENGEIEYLTESETFPGANPLIFQRMSILLNGHVIEKLRIGPKQQKTVDLQINIPKEEPYSDYSFSIVFLAQEPRDETSNEEHIGSSAVGGIATNVILSIGPREKAKGQLAEFSAPGFVEEGPVPFTVRLKNNTRHYIAPRGIIVIKNMFGQPVGKVDLLPVTILAGTIRAIPASGAAQLTPFDQPTAAWEEKFLLGPYTATLTVALSEEGPLFTKSIFFFALPNKLLFAAILMAFFVAIVYQRVKHRLKNS